MNRAVVVAIVVGLAAPARADKAKAEQYFHAGAEAFKKQSFSAAAENFELAYKELELPEIAFSAAQAYRRQYFVDPKPAYVKRAVELYKVYLANVKSGGRVSDAADGLEEMERELDKLTAHGEKIGGVEREATRLAVSVTVAGESKTSMTELSALPATDTLGAKALLDGKPIELFAPRDVEPGDHVVEVTAPGYEPVTEKRRVVPGSTELVEVALQPRPAQLAVHTEDGAHVAINGRPAGDAPLAAQELAAGHYLVAITARGREPVVRELDLGRGESHSLDVPLHRTSRRRAVPILVWAGAGLAVGCGVMTTIAIVANGKMNDLESQRETVGLTISQLADYRNWSSRRDETRDLAWGFGAAAVTAGALAAVLYWFDTPTATERAPTRAIVPAPTPGGAAVTVIGRF